MGSQIFIGMNLTPWRAPPPQPKRKTPRNGIAVPTISSKTWLHAERDATDPHIRDYLQLVDAVAEIADALMGANGMTAEAALDAAEKEVDRSGHEFTLLHLTPTTKRNILEFLK